MRKRFLLAATALAAVVPTLALAQARPAQPQPRPATPPAQQPRPAAQQPRPASSAMGTAQRVGAVELDLMPTVFIVRDEALADALYTFVDADMGKFAPGLVGRVNYQLAEKISLGAGIGFGTRGYTLLQPAASVTYTLNPGTQTSLHLSGQVQMSKFSGSRSGAGLVDGDMSGIGFMVGAGGRRFINENMAVRLDLRAGMESYSDEDVSAITGSAGVGIAYFMGGGPPRDTDADGVPDRRDGCANTPRGATVDARGCPQDTDRDGVYNGLDRCPDTPANTPVDANGCTRDSDRDGIADNTDRCPNTVAGTPVDANGCPRDADGDSVPDNADRCANTPRGTPVDANGCPRDSDGDGVLDPADRCPSTATGTPVDANGCPRDADGDGVHDGIDRCANTATGTQVDATGCPVARDADGDGVIDANDRCPATPTGRRVDANGCPLAEMPAQVGQTMVLRNVTFTGGSNRLTVASRPILDQIATAILATPNSRWEIGGHTDNRGAAAANLRLSQRRAQAVVDYLISKGVSRDAVTAVGYGSRNPTQPNTTLAGRAANRRVEVKRLQ